MYIGGGAALLVLLLAILMMLGVLPMKELTVGGMFALLCIGVGGPLFIKS